MGRHWATSGLVVLLAISSVGADDPPRGYSVPLIDLDGHSHRQVVVDREAGQYLGHPTTVLLEDGRTIITVYPKGHGRGAIVMKRSEDGGRTWSERLPVPENWATSQETPTIHRVIDAEGTKRLILFSGLYPVRMSVSEDDGRTWTPLEPVGDWGGIVTMGSVEALRTGPGHYIALFHDDGRFFTKQGKKTPEMTLHKTLSHDGGLTWSEPETIFASADVHLCEPGLVRSPDGRQMAVLLRENRRVRNSYLIVSNDEGRTWSEPRELPGALTGDRHTGKYAPDGRLFISFRDTTHESPTKGDWVGWVGTYEDLIEGREGQYRVRLKDNHKGADCAYPGVEVLPDGTFVTTTYGHWTPGEQPYVLSVRFTLEELDALAAEQTSEASEVIVRDVYVASERNPRYSEGSIVVLRDGSLLYATTEFLGGGSDFSSARIVARSSRDGGRTWSAPRVLQEQTGRTNVMSATLRWLDEPPGDDTPLGMFYLEKNSESDLQVLLRMSNDGGRTFGEPIRVTDEPGYHVLNNDRVLRLSTGRLLVPVASTPDVRKVNHFISHCWLSDDGGRTWRKGNGSVDLPRRGAMEPDVFELRDGRVGMIMRTQAGHIAVATSEDGGDTWGPSSAWSPKSPESPATVRRIPSTGDLLLVWNDTYREGAGHGGRRTPLTTAISRDDGRTWEHVRNLETDTEHSYAYTSLTFTDHRALLSYYVRDERSGRISSRFQSVPVTWFYEE